MNSNNNSMHTPTNKVRVAVSKENSKKSNYPKAYRPNKNKKLRVAVYDRIDGRAADLSQFPEKMKYATYNHFIQRHPDWILYEVYMDKSVSGTTPPMERPAYAHMIHDCKHGYIDLVAVKKVATLSRSLTELVEQVRYLSNMVPPVGVFFLYENIDTRNPDNELFLKYMKLLSEEESENKHESTPDSEMARYIQAGHCTEVIAEAFRSHYKTKR